MEQLKIVLVSIVLLASILKTDAVQCYECEGTPQSDCAKAIPESMNVTTCKGISVCHYVDTRTGSERSVSRGCTKYGPVDLCTILYQSSANFPIASRVFYCKTCSDDKCNIQITK
ncbi:hypothetical protein RI129_009222 [Pyrocoelia pectoralis]|uniref:Protein sleepless n=1 Tax=Pyrocoelia pectoralis TaxID=417401 RepID=A0AAN7ZEE7_9COLE